MHSVTAIHVEDIDLCNASPNQCINRNHVTIFRRWRRKTPAILFIAAHVTYHFSAMAEENPCYTIYSCPRDIPKIQNGGNQGLTSSLFMLTIPNICVHQKHKWSLSLYFTVRITTSIKFMNSVQQVMRMSCTVHRSTVSCQNMRPVSRLPQNLAQAVSRHLNRGSTTPPHHFSHMLGFRINMELLPKLKNEQGWLTDIDIQ